MLILVDEDYLRAIDHLLRNVFVYLTVLVSFVLSVDPPPLEWEPSSLPLGVPWSVLHKEGLSDVPQFILEISLHTSAAYGKGHSRIGSFT